jgi:hypothetical protein
MELLTVVFILVLGLAAFDGAALAWGRDSRDPMPDDHHR